MIKMMDMGMNIARLNCSHASHEYLADAIKNLRIAASNYSENRGIPYSLAIALDTRGPEIRTGYLENDELEIKLTRGEILKLTTNEKFKEKCSADTVYIDYDIGKVVRPGNRIFIDEGQMSLICEDITEDFLACTVEVGGFLGNFKGINLPGVAVDLPSISDKDKLDLQFAVEQDVDIIFASFVRNPEAVTEIKKILGERGRHIKVVAKIENHQGIHNLDDIIQISDGIMVSRGDLGIEIPSEKVFVAQKSCIAKCNKYGKPVICATQMLESMIRKPRPTRAESSDVANAVLDGADCIMLSGETAMGEYPLECVLTMARIAKEAEAAICQQKLFRDLIGKIIPPIDAGHTVAIAAVEASVLCRAAAIVVVTTTGRSANLISKYRPRCPIVAVTRNSTVARQLHLFRAVYPLEYTKPQCSDWLVEIEARVEAGVQFCKQRNLIEIGDAIIVVTGWKQGSEFTNTMRIMYVLKKSTFECAAMKS